MNRRWLGRRSSDTDTTDRTSLPHRILVIDDDEDDHRLLSMTLDKLAGRPYALDFATTFEAGLQGIRENSHDAYLVDQHLGAELGTALIRIARSEGSWPH